MPNRRETDYYDNLDFAKNFCAYRASCWNLTVYALRSGNCITGQQVDSGFQQTFQWSVYESCQFRSSAPTVDVTSHQRNYGLRLSQEICFSDKYSLSPAVVTPNRGKNVSPSIKLAFTSHYKPILFVLTRPCRYSTASTIHSFHSKNTYVPLRYEWSNLVNFRTCT